MNWTTEVPTKVGWYDVTGPSGNTTRANLTKVALKSLKKIGEFLQAHEVKFYGPIESPEETCQK